MDSNSDLSIKSFMTYLKYTTRWKAFFIFCLALEGAWQPLHAFAREASSVYIEDMTSPELHARIAGGTTTILVPIGGTEQSGPYIVLGKHNVRAQVLAGKIAQQLGNAVVAPVISYVPEGSITPPAGHMRFAGTISIPESTFESLLEATARSFKQHGFKDVVFLGDHGGYQKSEEKVAARLNKEWSVDPRCRVYALLDYYRVTQTTYVADLKKRGYSDAEIGVHAGLNDTALSLAVDKSLVRTELLAHGAKPTERDGVRGDPRRATAELGQIGVQRIVDTSVADIRTEVEKHSIQTKTQQK
jgi:creatinine amidohydrolase